MRSSSQHAADKGPACLPDYCTHMSRLGREPGPVLSHRHRHPMGTHCLPSYSYVVSHVHAT